MKQVILSNESLGDNSLRADDTSFVAIGYGLEVALPRDVQDGDSWEISISPFKTPSPVASTLLGEELFISSTHELLSTIRGNLFQCANSDYGTTDFNNHVNVNLNHRSTKLATFYNHIFLAVGRTLWWTDLDNYWNWYPAVDSEADFRTLEWQKDDITCLSVLNDVLFIHFPQAIYECVYVGKPSVVRITRRVTGAGAINSRSCIATKSALFFLGAENFYVWSIDIGLKEIGQEVWKDFSASISSVDSIWAYHDIRHHEICWVTPTLIWAFNYHEGHWQKFSTDRILSHATSPWHSNLLALTTLDTSSALEPDSWAKAESVWVTQCGIFREARNGDALAKLKPMSVPYLESDDFTYGDIHSYKTCDLVVLDAEMKSPWKGFRVLVAGKKRVSGSTEWLYQGEWVPGDEHRDFAAIAGKALRFRFELVSDLVTADGSFLLNGGQKLTGKRLDLLDGSVKLTSEKRPCGISCDNSQSTEKWQATVYAWGERTNLPERLVGPDK